MEAGGLTTLTTAFEWVLSNLTEFAEQMLSTPLFLIPIAIFAVGKGDKMMNGVQFLVLEDFRV